MLAESRAKLTVNVKLEGPNTAEKESADAVVYNRLWDFRNDNLCHTGPVALAANTYVGPTSFRVWSFEVRQLNLCSDFMKAKQFIFQNQMAENNVNSCILL